MSSMKGVELENRIKRGAAIVGRVLAIVAHSTERAQRKPTWEAALPGSPLPRAPGR